MVAGVTAFTERCAPQCEQGMWPSGDGSGAAAGCWEKHDDKSAEEEQRELECELECEVSAKERG